MRLHSHLTKNYQIRTQGISQLLEEILLIMSFKALLTTSFPGPLPNVVALLIGTSVVMVAAYCLSVPAYDAQNAMSAAGLNWMKRLITYQRVRNTHLTVYFDS